MQQGLLHVTIHTLAHIGPEPLQISSLILFTKALLQRFRLEKAPYRVGRDFREQLQNLDFHLINVSNSLHQYEPSRNEGPSTEAPLPPKTENICSCSVASPSLS